MFLFIDNIVCSQIFIIQFDILILCNNTEHLKNINKLCDMNFKIWNSNLIESELEFSSTLEKNKISLFTQKCIFSNFFFFF